METVQTALKRLVAYGIDKNLLDPADQTYAINAYLHLLRLTDYEDPAIEGELSLEEILAVLCDYAAEKGILESNSVVYRDLFDTALMGVITPRPSQVQKKFFDLYKENPESATDYYSRLAYDSDYIRAYRVCKDLKWQTATPYGDMDITINLSKPEKDPAAIAAAKLLPQSGYPKCLLCHENEGYAGNAGKPARQTLRQIPITMGGELWYLQYSPYVYYNEHCIALSAQHTPMKVSIKTVERIMDFITTFPHYFIGSNAGLPVVGGSILSHDHMQGGRYTFAMEKAPVKTPLYFQDHPNVKAGIVNWPMSVIRLTSESRTDLVKLASHIFDTWDGYTDESVFIFAETEGEPHNAITPIGRRKNGLFELDIVLRNNITTEEHPLGVYHPHEKWHHIKKENIGLIEVMGLAVLPSRLEREMAWLAEAMVAGTDMTADRRIASHADWAKEVMAKYPELCAENVQSILREEIGIAFYHILEDAGVFKTDEAGQAAFVRFCLACGATL